VAWVTAYQKHMAVGHTGLHYPALISSCWGLSQRSRLFRNTGKATRNGKSERIRSNATVTKVQLRLVDSH
jgi:hypothetical protein